MIKMFSVKNYKGFKDEIKIDFMDYKEYSFNKQAIKNNAINTALIYGKNGTGKSNFGFALFDLTTHLSDKNQNKYQESNYINGNSTEKYAYFNYIFLIDNKEIIYNYRKTGANQLAYEELFLDKKKIFEYNFEAKKGDFSNLNLVDAATLNIKKEDISISLLRFIANNTNESIMKKLLSFVDKMLWVRSLEANSYIGYLNGSEDLLVNIVKKQRIEEFNKFLEEAEIKVNLSLKTDTLGRTYLVDNFNNGAIPFWEIASNGTKVLTLFFYWSAFFNDISFLFLDEFDAFYHTELAEFIVRKILSKKSQFQTIFTTHNTDLMTNNLLRPDCFFILHEGKLASLPNCTEKELREGHNLEKMYRNGNFCE